MFESGILEVGMLLCFAAAWPVSILKSYKAKTARGKSLGFLVIVLIGYVFGIANKIFTDQVNYVLAFYVFNFMLVSLDAFVWFRNNRIDRSGGTSV